MKRNDHVKNLCLGGGWSAGDGILLRGLAVSCSLSHTEQIGKLSEYMAFTQDQYRIN